MNQHKIGKRPYIVLFLMALVGLLLLIMGIDGWSGESIKIYSRHSSTYYFATPKEHVLTYYLYTIGFTIFGLGLFLIAFILGIYVTFSKSESAKEIWHNLSQPIKSKRMKLPLWFVCAVIALFLSCIIYAAMKI